MWVRPPLPPTYRALSVKGALMSERVERATAAPGEKRELPERELCERPTVGADGRVHPCDREYGHKGAHSYRADR